MKPKTVVPQMLSVFQSHKSYFECGGESVCGRLGHFWVWACFSECEYGCPWWVWQCHILYILQSFLCNVVSLYIFYILHSQVSRRDPLTWPSLTPSQADLYKHCLLGLPMDMLGSYLPGKFQADNYLACSSTMAAAINLVSSVSVSGTY